LLGLDSLFASPNLLHCNTLQDCIDYGVREWESWIARTLSKRKGNCLLHCYDLCEFLVNEFKLSERDIKIVSGCVNGNNAEVHYGIRVDLRYSQVLLDPTYGRRIAKLYSDTCKTVKKDEKSSMTWYSSCLEDNEKLPSGDCRGKWEFSVEMSFDAKDQFRRKIMETIFCDSFCLSAQSPSLEKKVKCLACDWDVFKISYKDDRIPNKSIDTFAELQQFLREAPNLSLTPCLELVKNVWLLGVRIRKRASL
jgi:hypothetical protein